MRARRALEQFPTSILTPIRCACSHVIYEVERHILHPCNFENINPAKFVTAARVLDRDFCW